MAILSDMGITRLNSSPLVRLIVAATQVIGQLLPFRNRSGLFFFFPFCHVGGAERVHADIVECFSNEKPWIFFTKKSDNEKFRPFFHAGRSFNLWLFCKYGYPISVGIMAGLINSHPQAVVFGSNSLFYYLLLPYLRPEVRKVDLLHAFGGGAEEFSLPTVNLLDARVVINRQTAADFATQYANNAIDLKLLERIRVIENCVPVPPAIPRKSTAGELKIIYVGRDSAEKRVHLVGKIAAQTKDRGIQASFTLVGNIQTSSVGNGCTLTGEILDQTEMSRLYSEADLLLITSSREGFPLVIMEAMAHAVVPVSTAVGGIPQHIAHGENGWLVENHDSEQLIVDGFCSIIGQAASDRRMLEQLSQNAYRYAADKFSATLFCQSYRRLLKEGDRGHA